MKIIYKIRIKYLISKTSRELSYYVKNVGCFFIESKVNLKFGLKLFKDSKVDSVQGYA